MTTDTDGYHADMKKEEKILYYLSLLKVIHKKTKFYREHFNYVLVVLLSIQFGNPVQYASVVICFYDNPLFL